MLNLNDFFHSSTNPKCLDIQIDPHETERTALVEAKNALRDFLKSSIRKASVEVLGLLKPTEPKFRTQGSWRYKTCVRPAHNPPQEMDWDFGVYLPVSVWSESGPPTEMAKKYFDIVESDLKSFCKSKGWELDQGKKTCSRVRISKRAHIDIPLYAAPEAQFVRLVEAVALSASRKGNMVFASGIGLDESISFGEIPDDESWDDFDDQIHMATRDGQWKPSDPEAVFKWFEDRVEEHGEQLRRVARYVKAWRDQQWQNGGPTSVSLMIGVAQNFSRSDRRDDLALEEAFRRLAQSLSQPILEPGIDGGVEDFNRLDPHNGDRVLAAARALQAANALNQARNESEIEAVTKTLSQQFGPRLSASYLTTSQEASAAMVRNTAPSMVAAPVVGRTQAG
jgi:hypothetical protein